MQVILTQREFWKKKSQEVSIFKKKQIHVWQNSLQIKKKNKQIPIQFSKHYIIKLYSKHWVESQGKQETQLSYGV